MATRSRFASYALVLRRGGRLALRETAGTVLVCVEGSVCRIENIFRGDDALPYTVQVPLRAGESYVFEQAASVTITAESCAHLLCLRPEPAWRVWGARLLRRSAKYAMISNIRRGVEQSGSSSGS